MWGKLGHGYNVISLGHHAFVLEMIFIDNYCTGFMIPRGMVRITTLSTIVSLKNQFFVGLSF